MRNGLVSRMCAYNKALSEPNRMKMIKILGSHDEHTQTVSDIARILGISQPAATQHLKVLYNVDLVTRERVGTSVYYSLNVDALNDYQRQLEHAFAHAYTACPYEYKCEKCPQAETCV